MAEGQRIDVGDVVVDVLHDSCEKIIFIVSTRCVKILSYFANPEIIQARLVMGFVIPCVGYFPYRPCSFVVVLHNYTWRQLYTGVDSKGI